MSETRRPGDEQPEEIERASALLKAGLQGLDKLEETVRDALRVVPASVDVMTKTVASDIATDLQVISIATREVWCLKELGESSPLHLSPGSALFWSEAASRQLERFKHQVECPMDVTDGKSSKIVTLRRMQVDQSIAASHNDKDDATGNGSYAVALLAAQKLHGFRFVSQIPNKGGGFDFYLSQKPGILNSGEARLEVSGIREDDEAKLRDRIRLKRAQLDRGSTRVPQVSGTRFFIGVIGYQTPMVWFGEHKPKAV